tara:strand:+ start:223 stop:411 length:189 start_codon:yes stop_codon:yes gene_type:complete
MKNTETKCHAFWKTNRNPITMKKCADEKGLHIHNKSKEQMFNLEKTRSRRLKINYEDQSLNN